MIFLKWLTVEEFNATGIDQLFVYVATIVPFFIPMVLAGFFFISAIGSYLTQKALSNRGDFIVSFAVGGYLTLIVAFVMSLITNLINLSTLLVTFSVAVIGTILLLTSKDR